jgi:hypothetical protein
VWVPVWGILERVVLNDQASWVCSLVDRTHDIDLLQCLQVPNPIPLAESLVTNHLSLSLSLSGRKDIVVGRALTWAFHLGGEFLYASISFFSRGDELENYCRDDCTWKCWRGDGELVYPGTQELHCYW